MRAIAVVLPAIAGAQVYVDDIPVGHVGTTDASGYVEFSTSDLPVSYVSVSATGYEPYYQGGVMCPPGNFQIRIGVEADPSRPQDVILPALTPDVPPPPPPLPRVTVEGREFVANGQRHTIVGCTDLMLAWRYDLEGADAIRPVLAERQACGFNNLRVLWQKDIGNTGHSPWQMPTEKMAPFLALAQDYGFYVQGVILADCQVVNPNQLDQWGRVDAVRAATAGIDNHIEQLGNEYSKNGFDPRQFARPKDRLAANASNTEGGPYAPFWDFMCFSGQRSPLNHAIREYGPIEFMYGDVVAGVEIPAVCDEGMKPEKDSSDPRDFERAGAQARSACGGRFHSDAGTAGNSRLFTDTERACAQAFVFGIG